MKIIYKILFYFKFKKLDKKTLQLLLVTSTRYNPLVLEERYRKYYPIYRKALIKVCKKKGILKDVINNSN